MWWEEEILCFFPLRTLAFALLTGAPSSSSRGVSWDFARRVISDHPNALPGRRIDLRVGHLQRRRTEKAPVAPNSLEGNYRRKTRDCKREHISSAWARASRSSSARASRACARIFACARATRRSPSACAAPRRRRSRSSARRTSGSRGESESRRSIASSSEYEVQPLHREMPAHKRRRHQLVVRRHPLLGVRGARIDRADREEDH